TPNVLPIIQAQGSTTVREGQNVVLQVANPQPNTSYVWNTGQRGLTISSATSGNYFVTATNNSSCSRRSEPIAITVNPIQKPNISKSGVTEFCEGGSVTLTVTNPAGADQIRWSNGEIGNSITVTTSGNYYAVLEKGDCERMSDEVTVTVTPNILPIIQAQGSTTVCEGQNVVLQVANPQPNTTYVWNTGQTGLTISAATSGNYFVTATNNSSCTRTSEPMAITVNPIAKPTISLDIESPICSRDSVVLTINEIGASDRWNTGHPTK